MVEEAGASMSSITLEIRKVFMKETANWVLNDMQASVGWVVMVVFWKW